MNIRTLEYILAVSQLRHFGKAAEFCNVSQPTLSMQIKKIEEYYNIQIFERARNDVHLTRAGENMVESIKKILMEFKNMETIARTSALPEESDLILGAFPTLAPFYLPYIMPIITKHFPKLKLYLVEDRSPQLLEQLSNGKIDAAFLALPIQDQEQFNIYPLFEEPLFATLPANHPLADKKLISLKDLKDQPLLLLEDGHCLSGQALEVCEWAGLKSRHDFKATSIETLRQMVGNGLGITLIPEMAINPNDSRVRYIPIKEKNAMRKIGLIVRKTAPQAEFIDKLSYSLHKISPKP